MKNFFQKNLSIILLSFSFFVVAISILSFFSVSAVEYVEFEQDTVFSLDTWNRLPYTFYINAGCKAEYAEWLGDTLTISGIPNGTTCSIRADSEKIIELNLYSGQEGYLELSSNGGVVSTGGMITFGQTDIEIFGMPSYLIKSYIIAGSKAESVTYINHILSASNIPQNGSFGVENNGFTALRISSLSANTSLSFSTFQLSGSAYISSWNTQTTGSVSYEIGVFQENAPYVVEVNGVGISGGSVFSSGSPSKIVFSNSGSGEYFIYHTGLVEFEQDTVFSLDTWDRLPYTFYINAGCKAEYAEWLGDTLTISGIPNDITCSIRADSEKIIELNLYSGQEGYLELSSNGGVVSTGGMITFGQTDIEIFGLPAYSIKPYVVAGSKAESVIFSNEMLIINGIPKNGFFATKNNNFNSFKATPTHDNSSHIEFSTLQFAGSGYLTDWKTNSTGSITYEIGVGYGNEFYDIEREGVAVFEEARLSYGIPAKIVFSVAGSGNYFVNHLGLVDFEEDTIFSLESWGTLFPNRYIGTGSKAESVEYIGDTLNVIGIPAESTFHIKTDAHTVLKITPRDGQTHLTFYGLDVSFEGYISRYFIQTTGIVDYVVGTYLENIPYVITFNNQNIVGSPFNSGSGKQLIFNTAGNGEVLISAPGIIFEEDFRLELDGLN